MTVQGIVSAGNFSNPETLAITPDGAKMYVGNTGNSTVSVVTDLATNATVQGIISAGNFSGPRAIAFYTKWADGFCS